MQMCLHICIYVRLKTMIHCMNHRFQPNKLEYYILLKNDSCAYKYYVLRGQQSYIKRKVDERISDNYIKIIEIKYIPNASNLWIRMKEQLKHKIEYSGNNINLTDLEEDEFIEEIRNIYEQKRDVEIYAD